MGQNQKTNSNKKKLWIVLGVIAIVIIGIAVYVFLNVYPKYQMGKEISGLLQPILSAENQSMHLDVDMELGEETVNFDATAYFITDEEINYVVLEQKDLQQSLYITDNVLYLESGSAYQLAGNVKETNVQIDEVFVQIAAVFEVVDIIKTEEDAKEAYSVQITKEQAEELLEAMSLDETMSESLECLEVKLTARDGVLENIQMIGYVNLDAVGVGLSIMISEIRVLETGAYVIPKTIKQAVQTVDKESLLNLTEDLYPLVLAVNELAGKEELQGSVNLSADCGIVHFSYQMDLAELKTEDLESVDEEQIAQVPALIGVLCLEGELSCLEGNGVYKYQLTLDEAAMQKLISMIVPEMGNQIVNLVKGAVEVTVRENQICSMDVGIEGNINVLITEVPAEVKAGFVFE